MSPDVYELTISLFLGTVLLVFALKYGSAAYAARTRASAERTLLEMAQAGIAAQQATGNSLRSLAGEIAEMKKSLASIETILKQVG